jgi:hypothetical protein
MIPVCHVEPNLVPCAVLCVQACPLGQLASHAGTGVLGGLLGHVCGLYAVSGIRQCVEKVATLLRQVLLSCTVLVLAVPMLLAVAEKLFVAPGTA